MSSRAPSAWMSRRALRPPSSPTSSRTAGSTPFRWGPERCRVAAARLVFWLTARPELVCMLCPAQLDLFRGRQFRLRLNEKAPLRPRYEVKDVLVSLPPGQTNATFTVGEATSTARFGTLEAVIQVRAHPQRSAPPLLLSLTRVQTRAGLIAAADRSTRRSRWRSARRASRCTSSTTAASSRSSTCVPRKTLCAALPPGSGGAVDRP